jgi:hypothetical protein
MYTTLVVIALFLLVCKTSRMLKERYGKQALSKTIENQSFLEGYFTMGILGAITGIIIASFVGKYSPKEEIREKGIPLSTLYPTEAGFVPYITSSTKIEGVKQQNYSYCFGVNNDSSCIVIIPDGEHVVVFETLLGEPERQTVTKEIAEPYRNWAFDFLIKRHEVHYYLFPQKYITVEEDPTSRT